jgi:transcription elongation GreA/GreB family factor
MKPNQHIKAALLQACRNAIEQRITVAEQAMLDAQQSANSEEKSSAGDKYETGRAMSQIERDRCAKQLAEARQELTRLNKIDSNIEYARASAGALVVCDQNTYFIAAAIGAVTVDGYTILVISPASPLAQQLAGKQVNDCVRFNERQFCIKEIV